MADGPIQPNKRGWLSGVGSATAAVALAVALVIGMQLGGVPWRYRKQIWQLQGALVGAAVGYLMGRYLRWNQQDEPKP